MLVLLGDGVVLVAGRVGYFVEPAGVELVAQEGHPGGRDLALVDHVPVDALEPLVVFDRFAVLHQFMRTSCTPIRYFT